MKDSHKFWFLISSGFLTWIMTTFFPDSGGGISVLFLMNIPLFITLGIVFAFVYKFLSKRINHNDIKDIIFSILLFFMMALTILAYPF